MPTAALAKLTVPEPGRVCARPRLFAQLDDARRRGNLLWVAAPAGSGKTTLVATWLRARRLRAGWFQMDPADDDVAAFLYYLGQVRDGGRTPTSPVPAYSAEYVAGLPAFARTWFRRFFAGVPRLQALVLDDYHQLPEESPVHVALREGLAETPRGLMVIVTSRLDPPPALARLRTQDRFTLLDRASLRLTEDESVEIGRLRLGDDAPDASVLRALHARTQGWPAGLVLMLDHDPEAVLTDPDAPPEEVFDYFAGELLAQCEPRVQRFLLLSSLLNPLTPKATAAVTGMDDAADRLAELDRRNVFIVRHRTGDGERSYAYHPLFRQFLLEQARRRLPADTLSDARRTAAALLAGSGDVTGSLALLREAGDWAQVVATVIRHAPEMLNRGRFDTLSRWIGDIPPAHRAEVPWLDLFLGMCRLPYDALEARALLARAYDGLRARGTAAGEYMAWAGVIDTFIYAWSDFRPADPWIEEFDALRARHPQYPSRDTEARVAAAIFSILMYRRPEDPELPRWAERMEALLSQPIDPTLRMVAANHLVLYDLWWVGRIAEGNAVVARMETFADPQTVGPFVRILWDSISAIASWMSADHAAALEAVDHGLALARETGAHLWDFMLLGQGAFTSLSGNMPERARSYLGRMAALVGQRHLDALQYHFASVQDAVQRGDRDAVGLHARAGIECALQGGTPWAEVYARPALAHAHFLEGDVDAAAAELARAMAVAERIGCSNGRYYVHELAAEMAEARGDAAGLQAAVRALFTVMREQGFVNSAWWRDALMSRLCAVALEHDIETGFVRRLIRLRGLRPEGPAVGQERWPWPVRVHALGGLSIDVDGEPLRFAGKVQKRPLELLKALVAFGGTAVSDVQLAEALWPDAEGDDARASFVTTLQRLRKLLGHRDALLLQDGRLSLNRQVCRLDVEVFESVDPGAASADDLRRAMALYRGAFLAGDEAGWAIAPRERLRARFVRVAAALAERHAAQRHWKDAIACAEGALQVDDTVESFYQQLMTFQARAGRSADVRRTYRRCCDVLASTLHSIPSASTDALLRALGGERPPV